MKKVKIKPLLTALIVLAIVIAGCCMAKPVQRPEGCADSVIYEKINNPAMIGTLIQLANYEAIKNEKYKKEQAIVAITTVRDLLKKEPITFSEFLREVNPIADKYLKEYDTELLLMDAALAGLSVDIPINTCDKGLIITLCNKLINQLNIKEGPLIK